VLKLEIDRNELPEKQIIEGVTHKGKNPNSVALMTKNEIKELL